MKNRIIFLILFITPFYKTHALNIAQISVATISENEINIALDTEAIELYYYQSWQYSVSEATITLEVCFIPGFGSNIAYLNNNFQIPINNLQPQLYHIVVKAYYSLYDPENLQDMKEGIFTTPISGNVVLFNNTFRQNFQDIFYANPTHGEILVRNAINTIWIFDMVGRMVGRFYNRNEKIDISNLQDGLYIVGYFKQSQYKTTRVILKKN